MSFRQPIRTLLLAVTLIAVALAVRNHFETPTDSPTVDDNAVPAPVRVARDVHPTIVEPNENWLESPTDEAESTNLPDAHDPALLPGKAASSQIRGSTTFTR